MTPEAPVALITGATRGLGAAIAKELSSTHRIIVGGRSADSVMPALQAFPNALPLIADLADEKALATAFDRAMEVAGRLDVLVNNAGIGKKATIDETDRVQWRSVLETNLVAVADLTRIALPFLRESVGTIVMTNSGAGVRIYPSDAAYCVSKWALKAFTECLREQERGRVRVVSLHPGRIDTDMQVEMQAQAGRPYRPEEHMRPEDVARTVRLALDLPSSMNIDEIHLRTTEKK
ncbi:short-chain dehydrogenase/reductase family oxidoreductase [Schaalia cardiffensis F0333]|uniref:Short-chain dehydrogenase/reductase family oxidoreductase n=1 Tax=Schaalia cardiffensis F0333 TaxID=888050 RepID=N6WBC4_9ACTO|nr:SDR family oxidoreductase [Schaalia cardiffensis]ENO17539.1 short-chain dehydrogenase/reductase family oxidoreductase [Schaalia cardiffensis F0333]